MKHLSRVLTVSLLITSFQSCIVIGLAPEAATFKDRLLSLRQWDSFHYQDLVENGYRSAPGQITADDIHGRKVNGAFFPGYPLWAQWVSKLSGLGAGFSLLLASHLACVLFWAYFLLLLEALSVAAGLRLCAVTLCLAYPSSFFMVVGYSESTFMALLMGFLFWAHRWEKQRDEKSWGLAALHGIGMTLTRIVGLPATVFPLFRPSGIHLNRGRLVASAALTAVSSLGSVGFFVWCYFKLGQWDLYFSVQQVGWKNAPDYWAWFYPSSYLPRLFFENTYESINRISNLICLCLFVGLWKLRRSWNAGGKPWRGLYWVALGLFYVSLCGRANIQMEGMIRYNFPVICIQAVLFVIALQERGRTVRGVWIRLSGKLRLSLWFLFALSWSTQVWMIYRFVRGRWVA